MGDLNKARHRRKHGGQTLQSSTPWRLKTNVTIKMAIGERGRESELTQS